MGMDEARDGRDNPLQELSEILSREGSVRLVPYDIKTGSNRPREPQKSAAMGGMKSESKLYVNLCVLQALIIHPHGRPSYACAM
jgi:hypothetical protein